MPILIEIILRTLNIFLSRCSKPVSKSDEEHQALKLLLVTFDITLVDDLNL